MKINIKGPIISDGDSWIYRWFGIPAVSPASISSMIEAAVRNHSKELTVVINSGGGSVFAASEIYTELKSFNGSVNVEIVGIAASAASVIAMAGSKISMSPTAQLMIHNAATGSWGDYREMDHTSEFLQNTNKSIINAYTMKTGKTEEELKNMMDKETWMTAQQALEHGFIDTVMFEQEKAAVANIDRRELVNGVLPPEVIEKVRNELLKEKGHSIVSQLPPLVDPVNQAENNIKNKEEPKVMNEEQFKTEHQELYNQIRNAAMNEGIKAERARIQDIEELAMSGNEELVNKAKFETGISAEALAVEIIKAEKQRGANFLTARQEDANQLENIESTDAPENKKDNKQKAEEEAKAMAAYANKKRGVK